MVKIVTPQGGEVVEDGDDEEEGGVAIKNKNPAYCELVEFIYALCTQ